ncbi:MAG: hypothetical protein ACTSWR_00710 [Candidatus Helarchaeota archaeon]
MNNLDLVDAIAIAYKQTHQKRYLYYLLDQIHFLIDHYYKLLTNHLALDELNHDDYDILKELARNKIAALGIIDEVMRDYNSKDIMRLLVFWIFQIINRYNQNDVFLEYFNKQLKFRIVQHIKIAFYTVNNIRIPHYNFDEKIFTDDFKVLFEKLTDIEKYIVYHLYVKKMTPSVLATFINIEEATIWNIYQHALIKMNEPILNDILNYLWREAIE